MENEEEEQDCKHKEGKRKRDQKNGNWYNTKS